MRHQLKKLTRKAREYSYRGLNDMSENQEGPKYGRRATDRITSQNPVSWFRLNSSIVVFLAGVSSTILGFVIGGTIWYESINSRFISLEHDNDLMTKADVIHSVDNLKKDMISCDARLRELNTREDNTRAEVEMNRRAFEKNYNDLAAGMAKGDSDLKYSIGILEAKVGAALDFAQPRNFTTPARVTK